MALFRGHPVPARCLGKVLGNTVASPVGLPEVVLRFGIALLGGLDECFERLLSVQTRGEGEHEEDQAEGQA